MSNEAGQQLATKPAKEPKTKAGLVEQFSAKYGIEAGKMLEVLRGTAFKVAKNEVAATNEELAALLVVAHQYNLNPFTREIYAFRNRTGGIVPIVGVDGWIRMMHAQPTFKGVEFKYDDEGQWVEAKIETENRRPFVVREYLEENARATEPWTKMPKRMLRHRALIQCIRIAFGFGGIYEEDEGEAIAIASGVDLLPGSRNSAKAGTREPQPMPRQEAQKPASGASNADALGDLKELLAKTGVPDNLVLARFEVGGLDELSAEQLTQAIQFVNDNAP